jgi:peptidoglycan/xylan/chitin deacetylase (PgdA/CDA1 family)
MRATTFMYHDIVAQDEVRSSGFVGPAADSYKLGQGAFEEHLAAIAGSNGGPPQLVTGGTADSAVYFTFDDGGRGAYLQAAPALERHGLRGHFFVATDFINKPNFLNEEEIAELHRRGHVIGSHSASHPLRMALCSREQLRTEWGRSIERLAAILGTAVTVASVPGGMYSRTVAEEASRAGIRHLFNSEPVTRVREEGGCRVLGRFTVKRATSPQYVHSLAHGAIVPRAKEFLLWNSKKTAKRLGGGLYWRYRRGR